MSRRSSSELRGSIREAAADLFRERGFSRTVVRDIASRAGVDPAVVVRQFGSKELLFLETVELTIDDEPLLDVPLDRLGERFIEVLFENQADTRSVFLALLRGGGEAAIHDRLRRTHIDAFVAPLRRRMSGPDADLRARLAAALVGGLLYALWVVGDDELLATDHAVLVTRYGALLQQLLTPAP